MTFLKSIIKRWRQWQPTMRVETLALLTSLFFSLGCNNLFWKSTLAGRALTQADTWLFALGVGVALVALHFILLGLVLNRWTAKPLLALLIVTTAFSSYYMSTFTVFLDPGMLRNVLRTDVKEASELFNVGMLPYLLVFAVLPLLLLFRIGLRREPMRRALPIRLVALVVALLLGGGSIILLFHDLAPLMRNNKEIRYLITPANYLYSLANVLTTDASNARRPRLQIGLDAKLADSWQQRKKPALFVFVVGETARAANWGLSGYARQTTPELAKLDVINFSKVTSCGTNTEVSVPCMFSPMSREEYKSSQHKESLLDVVQRAGVPVLWRDNNSGCKGACDRVPYEDLSNAKDPQLCQGNECYDEILLKGLAERLQRQPGNLLLVLHQKGSHGPAYYLRYPQAFEQFKPVCRTNKLQECDRQSIVNAYDNTLLYTDHFLASTIRLLQQQSGYRSALWYMSDHGESLGENNLYLHGAPYAFAPETQTHIPMVQWISPAFAQSTGLNLDCLRQQAASQPASHDNLFHSVLGLLDIHTQVYDPALDLFRTCRSGH